MCGSNGERSRLGVLRGTASLFSTSAAGLTGAGEGGGSQLGTDSPTVCSSSRRLCISGVHVSVMLLSGRLIISRLAFLFFLLVCISEVIFLCNFHVLGLYHLCKGGI